jgi:hypothetical protein
LDEIDFLASIQSSGIGTSGYLVVFVIGLIFGVIPGVVIGYLIGRSRRKTNVTSAIPFSVPAPIATLPPTVEAQTPPPPVSRSLSRRCPRCNSTYTDPAIGFCLSDGVQLVPMTDSTPHNSQATLVYGADSSPEILPTQAYRPEKA